MENMEHALGGDCVKESFVWASKENLRELGLICTEGESEFDKEHWVASVGGNMLKQLFICIRITREHLFFYSKHENVSSLYVS